MITLEFKNGSDLDNQLLDTYKSFISPDTSMVSWIKNLDYVYDFKYSRGKTLQNTLYFETEQDKLFFLLKYS